MLRQQQQQVSPAVALRQQQQRMQHLALPPHRLLRQLQLSEAPNQVPAEALGCPAEAHGCPAAAGAATAAEAWRVKLPVTARHWRHQLGGAVAAAQQHAAAPLVMLVVGQ